MPNRRIAGFALLPALLLVLAGCFGGPSGPVKPDHLTAGARQALTGARYYQKGCFHRALEHYFRAHELYSAADQVEGVAESLNNIGNIYRALGELDSADAFLTEAAILFEQTGDQAGLRQALANRAAVLLNQDRLGEAAALLARARAIRLKDEKTPFAPVLRNQGVLAMKQGNPAGARDLLTQSLDATAPDNFPGTAAGHFALGRLLLSEGDNAAAAAHFQMALNADREAGFYPGIAEDLDALGDAFAAANLVGEAADAWKRSAKVYALLGNREKADGIRTKLAQAAKKAGMDLSVPDFFMDRWFGGEGYETPCGP